MTSLFEDHLGLDAVVAFADGEMPLVAFQRAAAHVMRCAACAAEVAEQTSARQQLRGAACPRIPGGLLEALRSIPVAAPLAAPPVGLSRDPLTGRVGRDAAPADGAPQRGGPADSPLGHRHAPALRGRGFRLGAGAIVAGLAAGAIAVAGVADRPPGPAGPNPYVGATQAGFAPTSAMQVAYRVGR